MTEHLAGATADQTVHPNPGSPAIVDVHAELGGGGEIVFWHEWRWQNGPSQGKGTIKVPQQPANAPPTPIHFNLRDNTGRHLRFSEDALGSIWVNRTECPGSQCADNQIPEDQIQQAPNLLKVVDVNSEECRLHYRLRFTGDDGIAPSYDPDITNGGRI